MLSPIVDQSEIRDADTLRIVLGKPEYSFPSLQNRVRK